MIRCLFVIPTLKEKKAKYIVHKSKSITEEISSLNRLRNKSHKTQPTKSWESPSKKLGISEYANIWRGHEKLAKCECLLLIKLYRLITYSFNVSLIAMQSRMLAYNRQWWWEFVVRRFKHRCWQKYTLQARIKWCHILNRRLPSPSARRLYEWQPWIDPGTLAIQNSFYMSNR